MKIFSSSNRPYKINARTYAAPLLLFISVSLFSMPAKRTPTVVLQPDGTSFSIIGFGDEHYNYAETADGYVVIQESDNYWYYAALSPEGRYISAGIRAAAPTRETNTPLMKSLSRHLRESDRVISEKITAHRTSRLTTGAIPAKNSGGLSKTESTVKRIIILCVQFSDLASANTALSFQTMVNDDTWKNGIGGMSKYFKEVSYNAVSVNADYKDWITAAQIKSYYACNNASYSAHVKELVKQCVDAAEANGVDFSQYDNDGDGAVDGLFIVHAGKGAEEGSDRNYIWSHQGALAGTYTIVYDGKTIDRYVIVPETYNSNHAEIGVFCHEFGHLLGLPDTYDTDGATNGLSEGLGNWCLMAGGSWGGNGFSPERPVHMSAYCKELLGCTTPAVAAASQTLTIPQAETNSFSYKIWMDNNQSDEYMLIENRQRTGFDLNIPGTGLLMYHIDKNLSDIWPGSNAINVTNTRLGIKLYEADGLEQMAAAVNRGSDGDPYPGSANKTSLTASTTPNSKLWDGTPSGVEIRSISVSSATMTASAVVPEYFGYPQQFYRKYTGYSFGSPGVNTGYGMVKCIPIRTGKLSGIRIFSYANQYASVSAAAFTSLSGNNLSSQTGSAVSGASAATASFIPLNFSPAIDVAQNVPIYVRIYFRVYSGGYAVPIDISSPFTGNSYTSFYGTAFTRQSAFDIPVRVVFLSNTALPVELTAFTASAAKNAVTLHWQTATETNNYGFDIERTTALPSTDGGSWRRIGFAEGNGTTNAPKSYSFADKIIASGTYSYRLKQIDRDGKFEYSQTVEAAVVLPVQFGLSQNYPNPFNPATVIKYSIASTSNVVLKVYNVLGKEIVTLVNEAKEPGNYSSTFVASLLANGLYFYRLEAGEFSDVKRLTLLK